jgi:hypothetical protein
MFSGVYGPMLYLRTRRPFPEKPLALQVLRWANWSLAETAATVGAHVHENGLDTRAAECAFETADPRFCRFGGECLVTVFTGGLQSEHSFSRQQDPEVEGQREIQSDKVIGCRDVGRDAQKIPAKDLVSYTRNQNGMTGGNIDISPELLNLI